MKAWHVSDDKSETDYATIVFAETRGQAHTLAIVA